MKLNKPGYLPGQLLEDGNLYVGVINDGKKTYHLSISQKDQPNQMNWKDAIQFNELLPTIQELNLISANANSLRLQKNDKYYWSSSENNNIYAWAECLSDGSQYFYDKNTTFWVRYVWRYYINNSFNYLKDELNELKNKIKEIENKLNEQ